MRSDSPFDFADEFPARVSCSRSEYCKLASSSITKKPCVLRQANLLFFLRAATLIAGEGHWFVNKNSYSPRFSRGIMIAPVVG